MDSDHDLDLVRDDLFLGTGAVWHRFDNRTLPPATHTPILATTGA